MAGMFCSIEEAAQRLGKAAEELRDMIKQGALREFRDGPNLLLKVDEIEEIARREGIEPPDVPLQEDVPPPPPLATIPTTLETKSEDDEMEEPEVRKFDAPEPPVLDEAVLDAPELEPLEDELPDLDLAELDTLESADEMPALQADEPLLATEGQLTDKEPPADKPKAKGKRKRKTKPKKQPKPRPIKVQLSSPPSLSFGQWLITGLRDDNLAAIIVLIMLMGLAIATCAAVGYGAKYAINNLL